MYALVGTGKQVDVIWLARMRDAGGIRHQGSRRGERVDVRSVRLVWGAGRAKELGKTMVLLHHDHDVGRLRHRREHRSGFESLDDRSATALLGGLPAPQGERDGGLRRGNISHELDLWVRVDRWSNCSSAGPNG